MVIKRKGVIRKTIKTNIPISQLGIQIPQVDYKVIADITMRTEFTGRITPLPTVLIHYLRPNEFLMIATIMEDIINDGECALTSEGFMRRIGISAPTLYDTKSSLRKMGLIQEEHMSNWKYRYHINWKAVNNLEELTKDEPPEIMMLIRKATRKTVLENLKREDVESSYTEKVLPYGHDPREEEIYD